MRIFAVNSFLPNIFNRKMLNLIHKNQLKVKLSSNKVTYLFEKGNHAYILHHLEIRFIIRRNFLIEFFNIVKS